MRKDGYMHFALHAETINGKSYQSAYQTLYTLEDGEINHVLEYFDTTLIISLLTDSQ